MKPRLVYNDRPFERRSASMKATSSKATPVKTTSVKLTHRPSSTTSHKQPPVMEARRIIEAQIADFLKAGGKINQIAQGVSGQLNLTGQKNIVVSKKPIKKTNA